MTSNETGVVLFDRTCSSCEYYYDNSSRIKRKEFTSLDDLVKQVNKTKSRYNCIVGVSGGVDSSMVLVKAVNLGLKPLAVHMDNGWNSEAAQNNIKNLVERLNVDLYTHVIDWDEYREHMNAFFNADVVDIELLYDNAMLAVNYNLALKFRIKHILAGTNHATEGVPMPRDWNWFKFDSKNIKAIIKKFGKRKIKTLPTIGLFKFILLSRILGIKWVDFLDYTDYNKKLALKELTSKYGYKPYPYKHYESIFTRFYQGYILPKKFNIDKRLVHLSADVLSGDMSRNVALKEIEKIPYISEELMRQDEQYFLKKMNWTKDELDDYISRPRIEHFNYSTSRPLYDYLVAVYLKLRNRV